MLSVALLAGVLAAGLGLIVAAASGDGSSGCGTANADSLQANRRRLSGIDHLLSRYDLSQADDPLVMLRRTPSEAESSDPSTEIGRARARARVRQREREILKGAPPYSPDNPYTEWARVVANLDAMKRQGADSDAVNAYLREYEKLSPTVGPAGKSTRRPMEEIVASAEASVDSIWYDTLHLARSASLASAQCFKSRAGLAVALPAFTVFVTLLFAAWWAWFGGRARKPDAAA
jgi:hypothetical protein